jgi:oligopeptide transport system substrate-binding protein
MKILQLILPLAVLAFAACAKRETAVSAGTRNQVLHWGNLGEPTDLDPHVITSVQDANLVMTMFEGLTSYDPKDLHPQPGVAERWESTPDGMTWTFHLRANAKWSNGETVTAGDFVYAFRRILSPGLGAEYSNMLFHLKNGEEYNKGKVTDFAQVGARAVDDRTLVLTLWHPLPYLPHIASHQAWFPVHRATIEKFGKMDQRGSLWTRPGNIVGNGPFVLAEWKPNQVIRVTKSPTYWDRDVVRLKEVNVYPIENETTEEAAFRSGQLHITAQVPIEKIAAYQKLPEKLLYQETQLSTYFYRFNVTKPPLNDVRVRRALSMAIDRRQIVERVSKGGQEPASNLTPPNIAGFTARSKTVTDIPGAQKLLAEAGFPGGAGFPRLELLYNTTEGHRKIAEAIQQMWRKNLGIDIGLYNQEAKVWHDTMRQMNYQIGRYAWGGDYLDPSTFLDLFETGNGNNLTGFSNAEYDALIREARITADNTKRYEIFQRCEDILTAESPIAPIYFYKRNVLMRPELKGWYGNLLDLHTLKLVYLDPAAAAK